MTWRHKGGRQPSGVVYVGRPTRWGNPYPVQTYGLNEALRRFREHLRARPDLVADAREVLTGYDLACYCPEGQPCHADEWLTLLNTSQVG
ncbi:DUF4326 domain-containing protein [Saccharomonospora piscinae]|uniref:DUF4326 domain-containing protein n=1 Tax=Saccharomonospora piscinae TaxID=687388 RepID=UPI00207BC388|nr:DUF4326 domain-containing protein [Saccharomonospora piscinae]